MNRQRKILVTVTYNDLGTIVDTKAEVQPERATGQWIYTGRTNVYGGAEIKCSECDETFMISSMIREHLYDFERFCRHCGAKMEGEK